MTRIFCLIACLIIGLGFLSAPASAEVVERIAAIVNDDIILLSEVEEVARSYRSMLVGIRDPDRRTAKEKEIHTKVVDSLIEDKLLQQQMKELNFSVSEREVDGAIERVMKQNNIPDQDTLKEALKQQGIEWTKYRGEVRKQLEKWQFINAKVGNRIKISDAEVELTYEKEKDSQESEYEYRASHILFRVAADDSPARDAAQRTRAEETLERLKAGEAFSQLAKELSEGPTARFGGDLGFFREGVMVKAFEDTVLALSEGETSGVVRSPFGYHIIRLTEKREVVSGGVDEAKSDIRQRLREEAMQREMAVWLKQLRGKAYVDIKFDRPPQEVEPVAVEADTPE